MKTAFYYFGLFLNWVIAVLLLAFILIITGIEPFMVDWGYTTGRAIGTPQLWLIALGITILMRPILRKWLKMETKEYSNVIATILIVVGVVWLALNVGLRLMYM